MGYRILTFGVSSDSNDLSSASDKGVIVNNYYSIEGSEICLLTEMIRVAVVILMFFVK